jgi:hypothetical protein
MGQDQIRVEKGLARGARQRLSRLLADDTKTEEDARHCLLGDIAARLSKKLSAIHVQEIVDNYKKRTQTIGMLRSSKIKHGQSSAATTLLNYSIKEQAMFVTESKKGLDPDNLFLDDKIRDSDLDLVFVFNLTKLFLSRSQFELLNVPWFINFNSHLVERWCIRTNSLDASPIIEEMRKNFGFIEYLRNTVSLESSLMPVAIPFKNGLALGNCIWMHFVDNETAEGEVKKISLFFRAGETFKKTKDDHPFLSHKIFNSAKELGTPTINLRTFVSFAEMKSDQIALHNKLILLRNKISTPMLDLYDIIVSHPPDTIVRRTPVPNFGSISKVFQESMKDVGIVTQELVASGLWERGIQLPRSNRYLNRMVNDL